MTMYHPKYGTLLNSREVSDQTGFTMNQLRYFRQNPDKSPFPLLKKGATTFYREQDIEKYLEAHGAIGEEYIVPENFEPAPLANPEYEAKSRKDFDKIAKITTMNSFNLEEKIVQSGWPNYYEGAMYIQNEGFRLFELATGEKVSDYFEPTTMAYNEARKSQPQIFWPIQCYGTRAGLRYSQNLDVTDQDIINAPIGEVPPTKQV
jgi:hypothetical protein